MAAGPQDTSASGGGAARMRADKWLWHARFFKTRGLATKQISAGHVRINGDKVSKPSHQISPGDVLTFPQGRLVRVIKVIGLSARRGPASEAQALYDDLSPPPERNEIPPDEGSVPKFDGKGRPSKKDRRNLMKTHRPPLD